MEWRWESHLRLTKALPTPLWSCLVDPGERFSAGGSFLPRGFLDPPGDVLDCPNFGGGVGGCRKELCSQFLGAGGLRCCLLHMLWCPGPLHATHNTALAHPNVSGAETEETWSGIRTVCQQLVIHKELDSEPKAAVSKKSTKSFILLVLSKQAVFPVVWAESSSLSE